jgi:hypothetical protein
MLGVWRAWILALFGAWFVLSAWALPAVTWNLIVFGGLMLIGALWTALDRPHEMTWRSWLVALFAAWLAASPWVLGYSHHLAATYVTLIVGLLGTIGAVWMAVGPGSPPPATASPEDQHSARREAS